MLVAMVSTGVHNATPVSLLNVNPTFGCSRIRYVNPLSSEALNLILAVLLTSTCITSSPSINGGSFSTIKNNPIRIHTMMLVLQKKNSNYEMRFTMAYYIIPMLTRSSLLEVSVFPEERASCLSPVAR